jgi:hypothetical protein
MTEFNLYSTEYVAKYMWLLECTHIIGNLISGERSPCGVRIWRDFCNSGCMEIHRPLWGLVATESTSDFALGARRSTWRQKGIQIKACDEEEAKWQPTFYHRNSKLSSSLFNYFQFPKNEPLQQIEHLYAKHKTIFRFRYDHFTSILTNGSS